MELYNRFSTTSRGLTAGKVVMDSRVGQAIKGVKPKTVGIANYCKNNEANQDWSATMWS
jgi:hypothetical protein